MEQKLKEKGIEAANIAADRLNIRINKQMLQLSAMMVKFGVKK